MGNFQKLTTPGIFPTVLIGALDVREGQEQFSVQFQPTLMARVKHTGLLSLHGRRNQCQCRRLWCRNAAWKHIISSSSPSVRNASASVHMDWSSSLRTRAGTFATTGDVNHRFGVVRLVAPLPSLHSDSFRECDDTRHELRNPSLCLANETFFELLGLVSAAAPVQRGSKRISRFGCLLHVLYYILH